MKWKRKRVTTSIVRNKSIVGNTIEGMMEIIINGEGMEGIEERDLVYNDGESKTVNPITNIRSDKMELMLEEKIGEQKFKHEKSQRIKEEKEKASQEGTTEE